MSSGTPVIVARGLGKTYDSERGPVAALADVSLEVLRGRFVSVVGPSGCGKSTLINLIAGLAIPSQGTLEIEGRPVTGPDPARTGVVFQEHLLLPWKSARENVEFPLALAGVARKERRDRAMALLDLVRLTEFAEAYPHELSIGMCQRVAIARGLVNDPHLLLMDEPFAALDEQSRTRMGQELLRIWQQTGKTVLFVTHSLVEAIYLADTVLVMSPRPARILERLEVDLPRPRRLEMLGDARLGSLRNRIWALIARTDDVGEEACASW